MADNERQYFIITTAHEAIWPRGVLLFWGPGHSGYATTLEMAGRYSEDEAREICRLRPQSGKPQEFMVPCDEIEKEAVRVVDLDKMKQFTGKHHWEASDGR